MRTGLHYLIGLSVSAVYCVCVAFIAFTGSESCPRPISTNPGSMEAGEYELTRETCFVARRLEVVAVARLLWISWCVLGAAGFRAGGGVDFFFERTRPAASMRPPCLIYLSTSASYNRTRGERILPSEKQNEQLEKIKGDSTKLVISALSTSQLASQMRQTAILASASFAYTIKCFLTQCWDLGGLGSRRSLTTRWLTASLSRALGRGGAVGTTT